MARRIPRPWSLAALMLCLLMVSMAGSGASVPAPPVELPPIPGKSVEIAIGIAQNAGGRGVATFVFAQEDGLWAALVVNATTPDGVDRVSVAYTLETRTLTIEVEDEVPSNVVTILVNGAYVEDLVAASDGSLIVEVTDAVNYGGLVASEDAGGEEVYVFIVTHFSVQTIRLSPASLELTLPDANLLTPVGWALVGVAVLVVLLATVIGTSRRQ